MRVFDGKTHTTDLPSTLSVLERSRPEILQADCQNYLGLPFHEEVKDTEVGHLFEHILLGHLAFLSKKSSAFEGETRWDWKKDPVGTFHITIEIDHGVFKKAWGKSATLLNDIFENDKPPSCGRGLPGCAL